jgi:hypothetical protein
MARRVHLRTASMSRKVALEAMAMFDLLFIVHEEAHRSPDVVEGLLRVLGAEV